MNILKVKYLFVVFCLASFGTEMIGQSRNVIGTYASPKTPVSKKKNNKVDPMMKLAKSITANAHTDSEKVYAIYRWIATHITYDNQLHISKDLQKKIYVSEESVVKNVLDRNMALCGGFAFLFRDLCEKVNVPVEVIHGFTKDNSGLVHDYKKPNHTWNAVKLNGQWKLLDITWAIGFGNNGKPDDFWYLTRPTDFIYSHYPENSKWTLLNGSISFSEFKKR